MFTFNNIYYNILWNQLRKYHIIRLKNSFMFFVSLPSRFQTSLYENTINKKILNFLLRKNQDQTQLMGLIKFLVKLRILHACILFIFNGVRFSFQGKLIFLTNVFPHGRFVLRVIHCYKHLYIHKSLYYNFINLYILKWVLQ